MNRAARRDPANLLIVAYSAALPNFDIAYWKFRSLKELETVAKAHLCLLRLVCPPVEDSVREAFG